MELINKLKEAIENKDWKNAHEILEELKNSLPEYAIEDLGDNSRFYFRNEKELLNEVKSMFEREIKDDMIVIVNDVEFPLVNYETFEEFKEDFEKHKTTETDLLHSLVKNLHQTLEYGTIESFKNTLDMIKILV